MSFDDVLRYVLNEATATQDVIRSIFIAFDTAIYYLLQFMYELFFNIATMTLLDGKMIFEIFSRVQLIIGIFMMFQLVMIIIKGIVNPDSFTDAKNGAGHIIMRIIVSLVLLALIVPINIKSPKNEYEKQINNNGILFGTLYSLQYRILANNTMGRLILGDDSTYYSSDNSKVLNIRRYANRFTTEIVKTFYQLNVDSNGEYICHDGFDTIYNGTENISIDELDPIVIIANGRLKCGNARFLLEGINLDTVAATNQYRLTMNWLSTIIGIVLVVVFFMLTFNVATRVFKLAALQLIAPIPIISYMDPKGSKDSAFNAWVKMLSTTYLELFIQLAVIYFSFAIINKFIEKFFNVGNAASTVWNTFIGGGSAALLRWTFIIMVIALFIFAKDAPKFFKQMLGIKDEGKGFFGAFGNAMGLGVAAVGAAGGFSSYRDAARDATMARLRNQNPNLTEDQARAMASRGFGNRARQTLSGLFGAGSSVAVGSAAASESKGNFLAKMFAAANASRTHNNKRRDFGADGGTTSGAVGSILDSVVRGENNHDRRERRLKAETQRIKDGQTALKARENALKQEKDVWANDKAVVDRFSSKAFDSHKTTASATYTVKDAWGNILRDAAGNPRTITITGNGRDYQSAYTSANDNGEGLVNEYQSRDANGNIVTITQAQYDALNDPDKADKYRKAAYFEFGNEKVYMASAQDVLSDMKKYDGYDYYAKAVRAHEAVSYLMGHRNIPDDEAHRADIENIIREVENLDKHGNLVNQLIVEGMDPARAAGFDNVIADSDIIGHRRGHREAMINLHMSRDHMDRATAEAQADIDMIATGGELKGALSNANLRMEAQATENARTAQELSARESAVAEEQRSYEAQKDKAEAGWFGKNGSGK